MPIKSYIGLPRQGKSYEVVTGTIYGSLSKGRRVVSNIAGLNRDAMLEVFVAGGGNPELFGELVMVSHEQVMEPLFWRTDKDRTEGIESFIQPGDVLALDEIWRFWSGFGLRDDAGNKRPVRVMNFFRMHGHFTHPETGFCCEIAFITQDIGDIHRSVRAVIDETYMMTKLTAVGSSKRYRVDIFHKDKVSRRPMRQLQRSYNPDYFQFYKSHSQREEGDAEPIEESPDQRGNILKGALFKVVLPVGALVMVGAIYTVVHFFNPKPKDTAANATASSASMEKPGPVVSHAKPSIDSSDDWRAAGYYVSSAGVSVVVLRDRQLRLLHNPPNIKITGAEVEAFLPSGEAVAGWTGGKAGGMLPGGR